MAFETFLEILARREPELFYKAAKDRRKQLREQAGRKVQDKIDELGGKPALFVKWADENPALVRDYNASVMDAGEDLEDDDGDVFKSNENPDTIYSTVIAKAKQLRASVPTMSEAQAVSKVLDSEPGLYSRYMRAKG